MVLYVLSLHRVACWKSLLNPVLSPKGEWRLSETRVLYVHALRKVPVDRHPYSISTADNIGVAVFDMFCGGLECGISAG